MTNTYTRNRHTVYYDTHERRWVIEAPDGNLYRAISKADAFEFADNDYYLTNDKYAYMY